MFDTPNKFLDRKQIESFVLATFLQRPDRLAAAAEQFDPAAFRLPDYRQVAQAVADLLGEGCQIDRKTLLKRLRGAALHRADYCAQNAPTLPEEIDPLALLTGKLGGQPPTLEEVEAEGAGPAAVCAGLAEIEPWQRRWLWPLRIAMGQLTLVAGESGAGKSLLACDLAARASAGRAWPDGAAGESRTVALVTTDEGAALARLRLDAAEADAARIHVVSGVADLDDSGRPRVRPFRLAADLDELSRMVGRLPDCGLLLIDPLPLSIGRRATQIAGDRECRLERLVSLARRRAVAVVGVVHPLSNHSGDAALTHAMRLATGGVASAAWLVARDPHREGVRLLLPAKNSCGPDEAGLAFRVADRGQGERVEWLDGAVAAESSSGRADRSEAAEWLRLALGEGPLPVTELFQLGRANGFTARMLHRAKPAAGVRVYREGFGPGASWKWSLASSRTCGVAEATGQHGTIDDRGSAIDDIAAAHR